MNVPSLRRVPLVVRRQARFVRIAQPDDPDLQPADRRLARRVHDHDSYGARKRNRANWLCRPERPRKASGGEIGRNRVSDRLAVFRGLVSCCRLFERGSVQFHSTLHFLGQTIEGYKINPRQYLNSQLVFLPLSQPDTFQSLPPSTSAFFFCCARLSTP